MCVACTTWCEVSSASIQACMEINEVFAAALPANWSPTYWYKRWLPGYHMQLAFRQLAWCHILHSLLEISRCTALLQDIISYNLLKVPFFRDPSESEFLALEHGCGFVFRCWPACTYDIPGLQRLNRTQIVSPMINNKGGDVVVVQTNDQWGLFLRGRCTLRKEVHNWP